MIEIDRLPKEPIKALKATLTYLIGRVPATDLTYQQMKDQNHPAYQDFIVASSVANAASKRLHNDDLLGVIETCLSPKATQTGKILKVSVERALSAVLAFEMSNHFLNAEDIKEFDEANVPEAERESIRASLNEARNLAARAVFLSDPVRRSFLHKISLAENELFKEKVGIQAFFSVAYEGSRLLNRYGEDAKPLAEAVEKARTSTEKHVSGYQAIEKEDPPKQIEGPKKED
jgi:hypothetical protein